MSPSCLSDGQRRGGRGGGGGGQGGSRPLVTIFRALKPKGGAKIRNCQCEILYKICKVQLVIKFKYSSNSGISIAIQFKQQFQGMGPLSPFLGAQQPEMSVSCLKS